jgi:hypothetical protein
MPSSKRWTYRQEIAQLQRRNRELRAALYARVAPPTQGVQVPDAPPERDAVRQAIKDREARLRALDKETRWNVLDRKP